MNIQRAMLILKVIFFKFDFRMMNYMHSISLWELIVNHIWEPCICRGMASVLCIMVSQAPSDRREGKGVEWDVGAQLPRRPRAHPIPRPSLPCDPMVIWMPWCKERTSYLCRCKALKYDLLSKSMKKSNAFNSSCENRIWKKNHH